MHWANNRVMIQGHTSTLLYSELELKVHGFMIPTPFNDCSMTKLDRLKLRIRCLTEDK